MSVTSIIYHCVIQSTTDISNVAYYGTLISQTTALNWSETFLFSDKVFSRNQRRFYARNLHASVCCLAINIWPIFTKIHGLYFKWSVWNLETLRKINELWIENDGIWKSLLNKLYLLCIFIITDETWTGTQNNNLNIDATVISVQFDLF